MDETRFRLVVREVKALKGPCAAVTGIVEGGSISVDDYVYRNSADGKIIRARVEGIMVAPHLELRTAEPGKVVWLMLRGRGAKQLRRGDVLEPPATGRRRHSTTIEVLTVILSILLIANLITGYVTDYGMLMCGVLFCSIPTMIVFFVLQKQFAEGITGAVK